jgi:hypothetical protein
MRRNQGQKCLLNASEVDFAAIGGIHQHANIDKLVVEALWWLLINESDVCLDLNLCTVMGFDDLSNN